jgi:ATP-dependent DNA helicase RecQ
MQAYAELTGCRREYLLRHFGEDTPPACEACDNCDSGKSRQTAEVQQEAASSDQPFAVKSRVAHRELGKGIVQGYEGDRVVVLFDEAGKKTLSLDAVQKNGLLEAAG